MYLGDSLAGGLMKAVFEKGGKGTIFYGFSLISGDVVAKIVGEQARGLSVSQIVPYPWSETDVVAREYRRLAERAKVPVNYLGFEGYINALVLFEALRRTGRDLTRAKLHATLKGLRMRVANMDVDFTRADNTGSRFVEMVRVSPEGRFVR